MHIRRLLVVLLAGASVSACARFTPYRTQLPPGHMEQAEPWGDFRAELRASELDRESIVKCAVDARAQEKEGGRLCKDPALAEEAIQHRYYSTSVEIMDGVVEDEEHRPDGDYYLSFVEFDDQGWFADRRQMDALFALLDDLADDGQETLIYVYAHGWKHNASATDNNVVCFSRLLERLDLGERMVLGSKRTVVGVYLGWRGLPFDAGALTNVSFWSRKEAATRVGRGSVFELLARLNDYRNGRRKTEADHPTQLIITGHSFGGLVIYSALSHALMERAAKASYRSDLAVRRDESGPPRQDEKAKSFGDFVMLVNPAFEGSLYEPLHQIATHRGYAEDQLPVMMIVTSEADSATRVAFPIGRTLGTLFEHKQTRDQDRSMREAVGHDPRYQTHYLIADEPGEPAAAGDCDCPYMEATATRNLRGLLNLLFAGIDGQAGMGVSYGEGVFLVPVTKLPPQYPFLVVRTNARMIADHNAIYNERFINFAQLFILEHILSRTPLAGSE